MPVKLSEYIKPLPLTARQSLAVQCGTTYLHLRNIAFSGKACAPSLAMALELATSRQVRRWELRPQDWHLIWDELIGSPGAPDVPEPTTQPGALDETAA